MNSLGYALLSLLTRKSCTGYELQQMMEAFWQARHSQIYPLLAKLEEEGMISVEYVEQSGKPDKKVCTITQKGKDVLREWIQTEPASPPIQRDEFLIKVYAISLLDKKVAIRLFQERIALYENRVAEWEKEIVRMEKEWGAGIVTSGHFGRYVIYQRRLRLDREELSWCRWVIRQLGAVD